MSESLHLSPERPSGAESAPITAERPAAAEYDDQQRNEQLTEARRAAAAESTSSKPHVNLPITDDRPYLIDHNVKLHRMRQNLASIQSYLSPRQRRFSRIIHQPAVSKVSAVAADTVSRPSGMLGGGLMAFVGSLAYLLSAYKLGFTYNFSMFIVFFVVGFMIGVAGEYLARAVRKRAAR